MDSLGVHRNQIPKMVKQISHRTGRYYYKPVEEYPSLLSNVPSSTEPGLHNPIVLASVAAGVLGVVIVIILIFTIWIRQCYTASNGVQHKIEYSTSESELDTKSNSAKSNSSVGNLMGSSRSTHTVMTIVDERPRMEYSLQNMNEIPT